MMGEAWPVLQWITPLPYVGLGDYGGDKKDSTPGNQSSPNVPTSDQAAAQATAAQTASRRALLASGGETTLTGIGGAPLLGSNINSPSAGGS